MCGIIGVTGEADALPILLGGLHQLEYRGYDSAGVALVAGGTVYRARKARAKPVPGVTTPSPVAQLADLTSDAPRSGVQAAIGHTRWATHGQPTDTNAHPHVDCTGHLALVHNGIIENHLELKADLVAKGHHFTSATDTEVMAHLIEDHLAADRAGGLAEATRHALSAVRGAFSIAVVHADEPDTIVGARRSTPLVFGLHDDAAFLASDIPALIGHTTEVFTLADDELVVLTPGHAAVSTLAGAPVTPEPLSITWNLEAAEKGGYDDFMSKEIHEQPEAIANTLLERNVLGGAVDLDELRISADALRHHRQGLHRRLWLELPRRAWSPSTRSRSGRGCPSKSTSLRSSATATPSSTNAPSSSGSPNRARRSTRRRPSARPPAAAPRSWSSRTWSTRRWPAPRTGCSTPGPGRRSAWRRRSATWRRSWRSRCSACTWAKPRIRLPAPEIDRILNAMETLPDLVSAWPWRDRATSTTSPAS